MSLILSGTDGLSDVDGSAATPAIRGTDANTGMFFPAADTIAFSEGGVEAMRLDSAGNMGIGTTNPTQKLQVAGNTLLNAGGGNTYLGVTSGSSSIQIGTDGTSQFVYGIGAFPLYFATNGTERMRIDSSGNVCIGTTSAYSKFCVTTTNGNLGITGGNTSGGNKIQSFGATTTSNGYLAFEGYSAEYMRIDSSGNVGIGTTTPNKGGVSRALTLNGSAGNIVEFCVSDTRVGWIYGDNNLAALSAGGSRYISLETNGATRMRINSTGSREFNTFNDSSINTGEATIAWGNVSSTTFDITTLFPNVIGTGSGVGIIIQLQTWTGASNSGTSVIGSGARASGSWAWTTVNNTNTGVGPTVTFSASGNVVTITFSFGAQYGKAKISLIATS